MTIVRPMFPPHGEPADVLYVKTPVTPDADDNVLVNLSDAFQELESEILDMTFASKLAMQQLGRAVGDLSCRDGKYVELPDVEQTELAVFAVKKMHDMAKELEAKYECLWREAVLPSKRCSGEMV